MANVNTLIDGAKKLDIDLDEGQIEKFILYKELLQEWNQKINITSITEDKEVDIKHFIDSIIPLKAELFKGKLKVIDIGTGGGFPGIPLKIMNENLDMVLLDSTNKKIRFLDEVIEKLKLKNIKAIHGRAEELGRDVDYREKYDVAISRAVASLDTLSEYALPFVNVGGHFISMKGPDVDEELNEGKKAIEILGGKIKSVEKIQIPDTDITHSLIIIEKIKKTPTKYPRGGGKPRKQPL
ncbi:MAG: 16S rRNA (guanine(527)-N(7))-methyltransferase RsmG [Tissierellia bacterium]|nr:16S rRNA (guanine(527)-N(7))-methyltransferase RsmG [Tissierellia bacterium]